MISKNGYFTATSILLFAFISLFSLRHKYVNSKMWLLLYKKRVIVGLSCCIMFVCAQGLFCQSLLGHLEFKNYVKQQYGGGTQNWNIQQDAQGRMYFANNEGVLTYDGGTWQVFPLPNETIVRSIGFGSKGRLYVGGQDELGYFEPDRFGRLRFVSLLPLMGKKDQKFADIWDVAVVGEQVFFRSSSKLFLLDNGQISVYRPTSSWEFLGKHGGHAIAQDKEKGLLIFNNGKWDILISPTALPKGFKMTAICPFKKDALVATSANGLFVLSGNRLTPFTITGAGINNRQFFTSLQTQGENGFFVGTYENGVYQIDGTGKLLASHSKKEGVLGNDVKCLFVDMHQNLWIGLDNGLCFLGGNNAISRINPDVFKGASGYAASSFNGKFYFALANGIYSAPLCRPNVYDCRSDAVRKIADGLSWKVAAMRGHLFTGREDGFYEIKQEALQPIDKSTGYWIFEPLSSLGDTLLLAAGNYLGLSIYSSKAAGPFLKKKDFSSLNTSSRFLAFDSLLQTIWVSHPYRGVYKISLPGHAVKLYTEKEGLPSYLNNHVFKIGGHILVATIKGIYVYDPATDRFGLSSHYDSIFHATSLRYLQDDAQGNLWFVHEKSLGVVDGDSHDLMYFPELKGKILSGFEHVLPLDSANVIIGGEEGFYYIDYDNYKRSFHLPKVYIRSIVAKSNIDSLLYGGYGEMPSDNQMRPTRLSHNWRSFHFEYSSPYYEHPLNVEYSYKLNGFDADWSDWETKTYKDYTNIPPGSYVFQVKVRNTMGQESSIASFHFALSPPWYATYYAIALYVLLVFSLFFSLWKLRERKLKAQQELHLLEERRKFEAEQKRLEDQHQLEMEKSENELIKLKNEKLESEIVFKNAELATAAMSLVQKKEFLLKIKDELSKLKTPSDAPANTIPASDLKKILRRFNSELNAGDEWEQFSLMFNKLHRDFLVVLKEKYPDLTATELKLSAYLLMNLSTKEIAHLMSISVRGVETGRYRLRKKLNLDRNDDLFEFLFALSTANPNNNDNPGA